MECEVNELRDSAGEPVVSAGTPGGLQWPRPWRRQRESAACKDRRDHPDRAGNAGNAGPRGEIGARGKAAPSDRGKLIAEVNGHFDDIGKQLEVQLTRMSQVQQQVDELREKVKKLSE